MPLNLAFLMTNSILYFISESRSFEVWRYLYEDMKMLKDRLQIIEVLFFAINLPTNLSSTESAVRQQKVMEPNNLQEALCPNSEIEKIIDVNFIEQQRHQFSDLYELAYISLKTIRIIERWPKIKKIRKLSSKYHCLKDELINQISNDPYTSKKNKEQILRFFTTGTNLKQCMTTLGVKKGMINKKVIFQPTTLTSSIFQQMLNESYNPRILQGHFGVSKTHSAILLCELSQHTCNYVLCQTFNYGPMGNRLLISDDLRKYCLINRFFYWNLDVRQDCPLVLQQKIVLQLTEIQKKSLLSPQNYGTFIFSKLKHLYSHKNLSITLIIDNFNSLASQIRKSNYKYDYRNHALVSWRNELEIKKSDKFIEQVQNAIQQSGYNGQEEKILEQKDEPILCFQLQYQSWKRIKSVQESLYYAEYLTDSCVALSSINLEKKLIEHNIKWFWSRREQSSLIIANINYEADYLTHYIQDISEFLLFSIQTKYDKQIKFEDRIQLKCLIVSQVQKVYQKEKICITQLDIRKFINRINFNDLELDEMLQNYNIVKFKQLLPKIIQQLTDQSVHSLIQEINNYIRKQSHEQYRSYERIVRTSILMGALEAVQSKSTSKQKIGSISFELKSCPYINTDYLNMNQVSLYVDTRIFHLQKVDGDYFVIINSPQRLLKVRDKLTSYKDELIRTGLMLKVQTLIPHTKNKRSEGNILQDLFICACQKSSNIKICLQKSLFRGSSSSEIQNITNFNNMVLVGSFQSIPKFKEKKLKNQYLLVKIFQEEIYNLINQINKKNLSQGSSFLHPHLKSKNEQQYSQKFDQNSKSIDCAIINIKKYSKETIQPAKHELTITLIDVAKNDLKVVQKINTFLLNYEQFGQIKLNSYTFLGEVYTVKVHFFVVCPLIETISNLQNSILNGGYSLENVKLKATLHPHIFQNQLPTVLRLVGVLNLQSELRISKNNEATDQLDLFERMKQEIIYKIIQQSEKKRLKNDRIMNKSSQRRKM